MKRYLIRLDDACPTMDRSLWSRMESLLDKYGILPMVGVIPDNKDEMQTIDEEDADGFWNIVRSWQDKGWDIALHGYDHVLSQLEGGINPIWKKSEFAGLPLAEQKEKIQKGIKILKDNGIEAEYFFAPCHTFDANTLTALREGSNIRIISDTIALKPYKRWDFTFIPQIGGVCRDMKLPGVYTFCYHPSKMSDEDFSRLEEFIKKNTSMFCSFSDLNLSNVKGKSIVDRFLSLLYFTYRRAKRVR